MSRVPSDIEFYIIAIYFVTTTVVGVVGLMQGVQMDASDPQVLVFRKPSMARLFMGMLSLMILSCVWIFANATRPEDRLLLWWIVDPAVVGLSVVLAYMAGPQDVRIDLTTRTCCVTKGWLFHPRRRTYPLTEASYLSVYSGSNVCLTMLRIGDTTDTRCALFMCNTKIQAFGFAQSLAGKLQLPVKDGKTPP